MTATIVALSVLALFLWTLRQRRSFPPPVHMAAWVTGLTLTAIGALVDLQASIDPGADLGADFEFGYLVRDLGGGVSWTGYSLAAMLIAFLLLALVDPGTAGRLLLTIGFLFPVFLGVLTVLSAFFAPADWTQTGIGPLMGAVLFFCAPACLAGAVLYGSQARAGPA